MNERVCASKTLVVVDSLHCGMCESLPAACRGDRVVCAARVHSARVSVQLAAAFRRPAHGAFALSAQVRLELRLRHRLRLRLRHVQCAAVCHCHCLCLCLLLHLRVGFGPRAAGDVCEPSGRERRSRSCGCGSGSPSALPPLCSRKRPPPLRASRSSSTGSSTTPSATAS